jgi:hypothetical protein
MLEDKNAVQEQIPVCSMKQATYFMATRYIDIGGKSEAAVIKPSPNLSFSAT